MNYRTIQELMDMVSNLPDYILNDFFLGQLYPQWLVCFLCTWPMQVQQNSLRNQLLLLLLDRLDTGSNFIGYIWRAVCLRLLGETLAFSLGWTYLTEKELELALLVLV